MHSWVHFLLIYAEQNNEILDNYFDVIQNRLNGLNELLNYPVQLINIMNLIESARVEFNSPDYTHHKYRKLILDAHECIDKIGEDIEYE